MLSDGELLEFIKDGYIVIDPFDEDNLTPNGYDLSIGGIEIDGEILETDMIYHIPPLTSFRVLSMEKIILTNGFTANLYLKQKYARQGIQATLSQVDAQFFGIFNFCCFNGNKKVLKLNLGAPFCQIIFNRLNMLPLKGYSERSGHYQNQSIKAENPQI